MLDYGLLILILGAIFIGFVLGTLRRSYSDSPSSDTDLDNKYFAGLNYLLNDRADEAVEALIKSLESSSDNVEMYMIVGRLFRRKGEIEKAIQIHQDILARPSLTEEESLQARLELAYDYQKSGLLDRAESLLLEIIKQEWSHKSEAIKSILSVYEQEKEWGKAIQLIMELPKVDRSLVVQASHYYAELADISLENKEYVTARQYIKKAMSMDRQEVRPFLQMGFLEYTLENYKDAALFLQEIAYKNPSFISESITLLESCYERIHSKNSLVDYLSYCLNNHPSVAVISAFARQIVCRQGKEEGYAFVKEQIIQRPSMKGLDLLIKYQVEKDYGEKQTLDLLKNITHKILQAVPIYRCACCGFECRELHWHCPRCHVWGKIEPIIGLEGQ